MWEHKAWWILVVYMTSYTRLIVHCSSWNKVKRYNRTIYLGSYSQTIKNHVNNFHGHIKSYETSIRLLVYRSGQVQGTFLDMLKYRSILNQLVVSDNYLVVPYKDGPIGK